jgi:hypothetical protein
MLWVILSMNGLDRKFRYSTTPNVELSDKEMDFMAGLFSIPQIAELDKKIYGDWRGSHETLEYAFLKHNSKLKRSVEEAREERKRVDSKE